MATVIIMFICRKVVRSSCERWFLAIQAGQPIPFRLKLCEKTQEKSHIL